MRIKSTKETISYDDTLSFFKKRIDKYKCDNPYSVTMYQDNNPGLVTARNEKEVLKLLPKLQLDQNSKVLDIACGIGRWSDAISITINEYCGVDFCDEFISLAKERNIEKPNRHFYVSSATRFANVLNDNGEGQFNRILCMGCFPYLNDDDAAKTLIAAESVSEKSSIVCIREPIGLQGRLTLKQHFSDELCDFYNAIYRTKQEFLSLFEDTLFPQGFSLLEEGYLFEDKQLNNRQETSQYYFILCRNI